MADKKSDAPQEPADTYHRHGQADPSGWDEQPTVTGRPNDLGSVTPEPALPNSTFGDRAKAAGSTDTKAVAADDVEDKSLKRSFRKKA